MIDFSLFFLNFLSLSFQDDKQALLQKPVSDKKKWIHDPSSKLNQAIDCFSFNFIFIFLANRTQFLFNQYIAFHLILFLLEKLRFSNTYFDEFD